MQNFLITPFEKVLNEEQISSLKKLATTPPDSSNESFDEWNVTTLHPRIAEQLAALQQQLFVRYVENNQLYKEMFPEAHGIEELKMRKYTGENFTLPDVDVKDLGTSRRILSFVFYINKPETRGETVFVKFQQKIEPQESGCVVYPSSWPWMRAEESGGGEKLIVLGYIHYVD